jgi:hypothetical protein
VRCDKCSYDNPADYRFCGMCGATLADPVEMQAPEIKRAAVSRDRVAPRVVPPLREERVVTPVREERYVPPIREERFIREDPPERSAPPISGPSFLGLGGEPSSGYDTYSRSPDYLLEDDEPRRSYGRFVFILLVLAAIGGLGWMRYTRGDWVPPWVRTALQSSRKPAQPTAEGTPATPDASAPAAPSASTSTGGTATESNIPPATGTTTPSATDAQTPAASTGTAAPPAAATNGTPSEAAKTPATKAPENRKSAEENAPDAGDEEAAARPPAAAKAPAKKTVAEDSEGEEEPSVRARSTRSSAAKAAPAKPVEETTPDDALVANAEKYLYGRGVPQNCDRALSALRAAAGRQNSRARSLLGTMYATGHCVGRDLPNAYRWFALASRENADNVWVQRNLEMIWREMTPQERQLATQRSQ